MKGRTSDIGGAHLSTVIRRAGDRLVAVMKGMSDGGKRPAVRAAMRCAVGARAGSREMRRALASGVGPIEAGRAARRGAGTARLVSLSKPCDLSDFVRGPTRDTIREVFAHELAERGPHWPSGEEYRKNWEVAMAVRSFRELGVLRPDAEILGVGAGNEPTLYWLTRHVGRVFATDLYLGAEWGESAVEAMLTDPGRYWPGSWDPQRLVVQHMDGRQLSYPDCSFDGVFSSSSIEHFGGLEDVGMAVDEAYRVLKPGGVLSLSTELRLAGKGPGLPGVLLFTRKQLLEFIVRRRPWLGGLASIRPSAQTIASAQSFSDAVKEVDAHVASNGAIYFHRLRWASYPHLVLRQDDYVWTSVHLALRKPCR